MIVHDLEQGTDAWKKIRLGRITASNMDQIITPTGEKSKSVDKYVNKLIAEQITGESSDTFEGNFNTERGHAFEEEAALYFAQLYDVELKRVGFVTTDDGRLGCSPDYLVGDDAILEVKTGLPHIMIETYLSGKLEQNHRPQTQSTLLITERKRAFTMLYNPLMKPIIIESGLIGPFGLNMVQFIEAAFVLMDEKKAALKKVGVL